MSVDGLGSRPNTGIQGQPGPRGRSIFSGDRVPQPTDGEPGDFYFDKLHRKFYGPKLQNVGWDMDDWVFIGIPSVVIGEAQQATLDALAATAAANAKIAQTEAARQDTIAATSAANAATANADAARAATIAATAAAQAVVDASATIFAARDATVAAKDTTLSAQASVVAASAMIGGLFDVGSSWYLLGRQVVEADVDPTYQVSAATYLDGTRYTLDSSVQLGAANGLTLIGKTLSFGTVQGITPIVSASFGQIEANSSWYYRGVAVVKARVDQTYQMISADMLNGSSYPSQAITVGVSNGLTVVGTQLKLGTVEGEFPLGDARIISNAGWYFRGKQVVRADVASDYQAIFVEMLDGSVYPIPVTTSPYVLPFGIDTTPGLGVAKGDSLSAGPLPGFIAARSGLTVLNEGVGGQQSPQIAIRTGGYGVKLTLSGNQIAAGANSVTQINGVAIPGMATGVNPDQRFLSTAASNATSSVNGRIGSVTGTLTRTATGGPPSTAETYTFTPTGGANLPVTCPANSIFVPDRGTIEYREQFICVGRNNYTQVSQVLADVDALVAAAQAGRKKITISGVLNGDYAGEYINGSGWNTINSINQALQAKYPQYFLDIRRLLIDRGLQVAGVSPTSGDLTDIANDVPPRSLRADAIHLTGGALGGYDVWAFFIQEFRIARGYA